MGSGIRYIGNDYNDGFNLMGNINHIHDIEYINVFNTKEDNLAAHSLSNALMKNVDFGSDETIDISKIMGTNDYTFGQII